jgi:hypothetical protein
MSVCWCPTFTTFRVRVTLLSTYYKFCSLALHTTTNTTSMIVSACHAVRLLTRAEDHVRRFRVMALQATLELTTVLVLGICILLLFTQSKEIYYYRRAVTCTCHCFCVAALTTLKLYHIRIFVNWTHKYTIFLFHFFSEIL